MQTGWEPKDPMLLFHAGMIAAKLDHPAAAVTQLKEALSINPQFNVLYAPLARQELDALHAQTMVASGAAAAAQSGKTADVSVSESCCSCPCLSLLPVQLCLRIRWATSASIIMRRSR